MNNSKLALIQEYCESNRAKNYTNDLICKVNKTLDQKNERVTKLPKSKAGCTLKKVSLLPRQNAKSGGQGFFVQGYWSSKWMVTKTHRKGKWDTCPGTRQQSHSSRFATSSHRLGRGRPPLIIGLGLVRWKTRTGWGTVNPRTAGTTIGKPAGRTGCGALSLFHDLHSILEVPEPLGYEEPEGTSLCPWTEGPAAWKLKSSTLMLDQSTKLVVAACWRNARS